jgi:molybdopterin synthase catalytic subunit
MFCGRVTRFRSFHPCKADDPQGFSASDNERTPHAKAAKSATQDIFSLRSWRPLREAHFIGIVPLLFWVLVLVRAALAAHRPHNVRRELTLTTDKIDEAALLAGRAASVEMGAMVCFAGLVRGWEDQQPIAGLDYEMFEAMARHQFDLLFDQAQSRWPIQSIRLVHRVGGVAAGEASLWVEVIAPHRQEAFAACQFLIDEMKKVVPIWKKPMTGPNPQPANRPSSVKP